MEANGKICCVRPAPSSRGEQHVLSTNFPPIRTHQQQTMVTATEPPNISIMADFQAAAFLPFLPLQFDQRDAAATRAVVQVSGAVAVIPKKRDTPSTPFEPFRTSPCPCHPTNTS